MWFITYISSMKKFAFIVLSIFLPSILVAQDIQPISDTVSTEDTTITQEIIDTEDTSIDENNINIEYTNNETTLNLLWDDGIENDNQTEIEDEDTDKEFAEYIWLWNIHFWFCDQWIDNLSEWLNMAIEQWKTSEVCLAFYNDAREDIEINVDYTVLGVDQDGWPSCSIDNSFEQYIENIDQIKNLVIPGGELVQTSMKLYFPIWIEWDLWWCLAFSVVDAQWDDNWGGWITLSTIIRRAYHMHFFVWGIQNVKNELQIDNIESHLNENKELILTFNITNIWNLEESLEIWGYVSNIFGYKKEFVVEWWRVSPNKTLPIEINIGTIASYGWLFDININVVSTPFFSYNISNSSIDPTLLEAKEFTASTTFFQMPWLILIIVIILILLIITIFRKPKQKVVYVQAPQQPTPNTGYQQPQYTQPEQPQYQAPQQPVQPQYPNNPQYWQPMPQQNPQPTPPQINPNN